MRKIQGSSWIWGLLALGALAGACTIETKDKGDNEGGSSGGDAARGGGANGGSGATGGSEAGNSGADAGSGGTSAGEGGAGSGATGTGGGEAGSGGDDSEAGSGGAAQGGAAGSGGGPSTPSVTLLDCTTRAASGATVAPRVIDVDTTWSGTVYLKNVVEIRDGVTLTIEPGTNVVMGPDASLDIGWNTGAATVMAAGTEAKPIRFCGEQPDAGFWRGIIVERNVTSNSQFHHVLISDAGATEQALNLIADIDVQNVQVRNAQNDGVRAEDFKAGSSGLSVEGVGGTALVLAHSNAIEHFPLGGRFENNGKNVAAIDFRAVDAPTTFHDLGVPYQQAGDLQIRAVEVVFEPGVSYLFGPDGSMEIGWNGNAATVTAEGTKDAPIVFDGVMKESGYWQGIKIQNKVTSNSLLSHVEIRHAGGNGAYALEVYAPITLADLTLSDNDAGAYIAAQGLDADSKNVTITKGEQRPLTIQPNALVSLPASSSFTGNAVDEIAIEGGSYDQTGTVINPGVPFRLLAGLRTLDSSLTLSAGSEFIMPADSLLEVGWNTNQATFVAVGTAAEPIRFIGGEDTAGFWGGLTFGTKVLSASKLDYVEVRNGKDACLTLRSSIPVTHSTFAACEGYGILKASADTRDYESTNTFSDVGSGGVGTL